MEKSEECEKLRKEYSSSLFLQNSSTALAHNQTGEIDSSPRLSHNTRIRRSASHLATLRSTYRTAMEVSDLI
jgi:hypothetical protein